MRKMFSRLLFWRNLFILLFFSLVASFSMDLIMAFLRRSMMGETDSIFYALLGFFGLLAGGFGVIRFVYRYDKAQGRVKREIGLFEK